MDHYHHTHQEGEQEPAHTYTKWLYYFIRLEALISSANKSSASHK